MLQVLQKYFTIATYLRVLVLVLTIEKYYIDVLISSTYTPHRKPAMYTYVCTEYVRMYVYTFNVICISLIHYYYVLLTFSVSFLASCVAS